MAVGATMEGMVTADMMLVCERFGVFVPGVLNVSGRAARTGKIADKNHNSCRVDRPNREIRPTAHTKSSEVELCVMLTWI